MCVLLHPISREINDGSLAQLNRASDYGSEGCRFESCRSHEAKRKVISSFFCFRAYSATRQYLFFFFVFFENPFLL